MTEPVKRKIWLLPLLAFFALAGAWLVLRLVFPPFTPPVLPVPNGYDELLRAAELVAKRTGFYDEMQQEELTRIVDQNAPALKLAREALQKECRVSIDWNATNENFESHLDQIQSLRELSRAFAAAARLAKVEGRLEESVQCGLDALELVTATARGGLLVDRMTAGGICYGALYSLREQVAALPKDDCLRLRKTLSTLSLEWEDPEEVIRRDFAHGHRRNGQLQSLMMLGLMRAQRQQSLDQMEEMELRITALLRLLETHLALRAYHLDHESLPTKLDELVPDYLGEVPQDTFREEPLVYHRENTSYKLYSVGTNGVDDDGVETTSGNQADLTLDLDVEE